MLTAWYIGVSDGVYRASHATQASLLEQTLSSSHQDLPRRYTSSDSTGELIKPSAIEILRPGS